MRSKMLGLAIALMTFGLGVSATTFWIARHTVFVNEERRVEPIRATCCALTPAAPVPADEDAPCEAMKILGSRYDSPPDLTIRGGVLNGKAISKPAPAYPPIARAARSSGMVVVQVKIDRCGNVVSAEAVSGAPLLRQAAVDAAKKWRFSPTLLSGYPVKVIGTITFNFLLQ